jgi:hypothetical protein
MSRTSYLGRAADRFMNLDSASYGDERERVVFMEASTFGTTIGTYLHLLGAVIAAAFGQLLLPLVLLVLMCVPALATGWYAARRDVDVPELAERAEAATKAVHLVLVYGGIVLVLVGMLYTVSTGHGLVPVPEPDLTSADTRRLLTSLLGGATIGGVVGGAAAAGWSVMKALRSTRAPVEDGD